MRSVLERGLPRWNGAAQVEGRVFSREVADRGDGFPANDTLSDKIPDIGFVDPRQFLLPHIGRAPLYAAVLTRQEPDQPVALPRHPHLGVLLRSVQPEIYWPRIAREGFRRFLRLAQMVAANLLDRARHHDQPGQRPHDEWNPDQPSQPDVPPRETRHPDPLGHGGVLLSCFSCEGGALWPLPPRCNRSRSSAGRSPASRTADCRSHRPAARSMGGWGRLRYRPRRALPMPAALRR